MSKLRSIEKVGSKEYLVDKLTGEVIAADELKGRMVWVTQTDLRKTGFLILNQDGAKGLADRKLTGATYILALHLLSVLDFENWILQSQREMANSLGWSLQQVGKYLKILQQKDVISLEKKANSIYLLRFNPEICWKGVVKTQAKAIENMVANNFKAREKQIKKKVRPCGQDATFCGWCQPVDNCALCDADINNVFNSIDRLKIFPEQIQRTIFDELC